MKIDFNEVVSSQIKCLKEDFIISEEVLEDYFEIAIYNFEEDLRLFMESMSYGIKKPKYKKALKKLNKKFGF